MLSINATALVVFAVVWILVIVLTRIFFKPILRVLDERAARIAKDKAAADGARKAYEADLKRIEDGLKEARAAADAIRNTAETEALKDKSRLVREVQAEGRAEVEKAKAELAARDRKRSRRSSTSAPRRSPSPSKRGSWENERATCRRRWTSSARSSTPCILFGGLTFVLRKPLKAMLAKRTVDVGESIDQAEAGRTEAEAEARDRVEGQAGRSRGRGQRSQGRGGRRGEDAKPRASPGPPPRRPSASRSSPARSSTNRSGGASASSRPTPPAGPPISPARGSAGA